MQRVFLFACGCSVLAFSLLVSGTAEARETTRVLVRVRSDIERPARYLKTALEKAQLAHSSVTSLFQSPLFSKTAETKGVFVVQADEDTATLLRVLRRDKAVLYAEPDATVRASLTPNDPNYSSQWHLPMIHVEEAWDADTAAPTYGGDPSVIIAVLDTGAAYEQYTSGSVTYGKAPDFEGTVFATGYDFVNNDEHPNDDNGHGTHVAATIAEQTNNGVSASGIAFNATLLPIKILNNNGVGTISDVVRGIDYAAQHSASIINLSLGSSTPSQTLLESVQRALAKNIIVVAAVGNDAAASVSYPAAYDGVLAVSAVGKDLSLASYSNHGQGVSLAAPGGDGSDFVWQETYSNLDTNHLPKDFTTFGVVGYQGTSQASPQVTAAAALLLAQSVPATQIPSLLKMTATDLGTPGYDTSFGYGLLNVAAALQAVSNDTTVPVTTLTATPSSPDGLNGYYKTRPSLTLTATDGAAGSGIAATYYHWDNDADVAYTQPIAAPDGVHTVTYYSVDAAGNREAALTAIYTVDATPPEVSLQSPTSSPKKRRVTITGVVQDELSGTKSLLLNGVTVAVQEDGTFTADITLRQGQNTLSFLATDNAGASTEIPYSLRLVRSASLVVTRSGEETPAVLRVDETGKRLAKFFAFDQSFRGGVSLTTGDLNGDGSDEIIVAPARGRAQVRIFSSSGKLVGQFFAFDQSFRGGVHLATADVDGDGSEEILVAPASKGGPQVRIFSRSGALRQQFFAYPKDFTGGVRVASIDYNNDGAEEVLVAPAGTQPFPMKIYSAAGTPLRRITDFSTRGMSDIAIGVGDIFGTGEQRIVAVPSEGNMKLFLYDEEGVLQKKIALPIAWRNATRLIAVGDLEGLGKDRVILGRGATSTLPIALLDEKGKVIRKFQPFSTDAAGGWGFEVLYTP